MAGCLILPCLAGGELRIQSARIRGFDPARANDVATALAVSRIYEGLLQYDYHARPYAVRPLLAAGLPDVSDNGRVYRFTLRAGIRFQDDPCFTATAGRGRSVTAEDIRHGILRVADPRTGSTGFWAFRDRIAGLDAWRDALRTEPTREPPPPDGLRTEGTLGLTITLNQPYPQLVWVLTLPYAAAVPREATDHYGPDFVNHPVGTGPYRLARWRQNHEYVYERNPDWGGAGRRDADLPGGIPGPARIVESVVDDAATAWMLFLRGRLHLAGVGRDNWDAVVRPDGMLDPALEARGIRLERAPTLDINYIGFNMDDPVVGTNRALRQALTCAFDGAAWQAFHHGRLLRPDGPVPPGVPGFVAHPSPFPHDQARARRLLAEAGYPEGRDPNTGRRLVLTLEVGSAESAEYRQGIELIANFMDRVGVVLRASYNNRPALFEKIERRQAQMFALSWVADYPDAQNFLQLFYGRNASPGPNRANYTDRDFDRWYEEALGLDDGPRRRELYARMVERVVWDCPWIFTGIPVAHVLVRPELRGYRHHDFPYGMVKYYDVHE